MRSNVLGKIPDCSFNSFVASLKLNLFPIIVYVLPAFVHPYANNKADLPSSFTLLFICNLILFFIGEPGNDSLRFVVLMLFENNPSTNGAATLSNTSFWVFLCACDEFEK